ncbi:MAG: hypothetical protein P8P20_01415, partial [Acidimicrobiales bacterium]|nr:hypothetical protein [Acidimicrobiales bacterium]
MASLTNLLGEVRSCNVCIAHLPAGPRPIVQMDTTASIVIIGQAPGRRVHDVLGLVAWIPSGVRAKSRDSGRVIRFT